MGRVRDISAAAGLTLALTAGAGFALASPYVASRATSSPATASQRPPAARNAVSPSAGGGAATTGTAPAKAARTALPCSTELPGGNWPSYGHDASNSRNQPDEHSIRPSLPAGLTPAWTFKLSSAGDAGQFDSTPVLAAGCAFVGSTNAVVYAINAATGAEIWHRALPAPTPGLGGAMVSSVALWNNEVIALVNQSGDGTSSGPYLAALNQHTGAIIWRSAPFVTTSGYYTNASPQVFNGIIFAGFSPPEGDPTGQGGFALLNAANGALLKLTPTIPPARQKLGYAGGGIWSTPAFDPSTQYAYVGAGNPYSKAVEDPHTNAILKVDLGLRRSTFGQIVAAYKGNVDQYTQTLQQLSQTPVCSVSTGLPDPFDDPVCGQLDLDFGASPNLFRSNGRLVVGDLQKSGVYHVASASDMSPVWSTVVGGSCLLCNAASTAVAGGGVFGESTPGGAAFGLSQASGGLDWATPVGDGVHYQSTSTANGVVYSFDTTGFFDAYDAATGTLLMRRPLSADAGAPAVSFTSGGIAIAYHTVFVAASEGGPAAGTPQDGYLIAYAG